MDFNRPCVYNSKNLTMAAPSTLASLASAADEADARAFEAFARTQDPLALQAATWATRRQNGLDAVGEAEFQRWLAAAPTHAEAFDATQASYARVRALPPEVRAHLLGRPAPAPSSAAFSPTRRSWLHGAALAGSACAVVGGAWLGWQQWAQQVQFAQSFAAARGQRRSVRLPDGSTLELDAATQVAVRFTRQRREVQLADGQAMFSVQAHADQPFDVLAGALRITVVGTRFSVRHVRAGLDAGQTVVAVEEGRVRVQAQHAADAGVAPGVLLTAGQSVRGDDLGHLEAISQVSPAAVAPWRSGRISFTDATLAQALAEFERYGDTGLVLRDPAVAALRFGGSFDVQQVRSFTQALPQLLPVRLAPVGVSTEIVAR